MSEVDFSGQTALVTGASRGIGAEAAKAIAARGAHVIVTARDVAKLEGVEQAIHEAGGSATIAPLDLAEPDAIARLATAVAERWDALDILVINAALLPQLTSVPDIDPTEFNRAITVNLLATQALIAGFDPLLRKSKDARLVGMTSSVGAAPRAYWGAYASTKAAFDCLLQCYAQETEKIARLRVALLNPGATRTTMRARAYPGEDPASVKPPEVVAQALVELLGSDFASGARQDVNHPS